MNQSINHSAKILTQLLCLKRTLTDWDVYYAILINSELDPARLDSLSQPWSRLW